MTDYEADRLYVENAVVVPLGEQFVWAGRDYRDGKVTFRNLQLIRPMWPSRIFLRRRLRIARPLAAHLRTLLYVSKSIRAS